MSWQDEMKESQKSLSRAKQRKLEIRTKATFPNCKNLFPDCPKIDVENPAEECKKCPNFVTYK